MNVRLASTADAHAIAVIHVRAWRSAYRGIIPDAVLAELSVRQRERMWHRVIAERRAHVLVVDDGGTIIGWISVGPSRDQGANPDVAEIFAIYVDPEHWHRGAGRLLWQSMRAYVSQSPIKRVTLWVLDANQPARGFYHAMGFVEEGVSKSIDIEGTALVEVRYSWSVSA